MRPAAHLPSFASSKEGRPRKDDPAARVPTRPVGEWGNLRCSVLGDAEELPALPLRGSSGQTASASQMTMRVSFGTRSPQALRFSARSEGGGSGLHSGHCFARPVVLRCARLARAISHRVGSAQREPTPGAAAKQQPSGTRSPPLLAAPRRAGAGVGVCAEGHTRFVI